MTQQTQTILKNSGLLDKLPDPNLASKLGELLEKRLIVALSIHIPPKKNQELQTKLQNNDPDIAEYLQKNIPNCSDILKNEINKFKSEIEQML